MPPEGRDLIRKKLHEAGICYSFFEAAWAQRKYLSSTSTLYILTVTDAFIRDESSKGRYDPGLTKICFEMLLELFNRTLRSDLGPRVGGEQEIEDVC